MIINPKTVFINGKFLSDKMQGIVRYGREMLLAIDKNIQNKPIDITVLYPKDAYDLPKLVNIKYQQIGNNLGIKWEQTDLRKRIKQHKDSICVNFCNTAPLFVQPGITTIHDIMYLTDKKNYTGIKKRISSLWHRYQYAYIAKHEKWILTDSYYSKNQIERYYPKAIGKIVVVYCSWEHVLRYKENLDWQKQYDFLKPKDYFFSLASLSKNKNGMWIIEVAKRHPEYTFVIGGNFYNDPKMKVDSVPDNVHLLGFIDDADACSLIKNCKAFVFPSLNEGFGLPPLEALALGAPVISSNAASLPEVLGDSVHYIDPNNYDVDLLALLNEKVSPSYEAMNKYSYDKSADALISLLENKGKEDNE